MKIAIICSVRDADQQYVDKLYVYVKELEKQGHKVHLPQRDTNQKGTSLEICRTNIDAIENAEEVHIFYCSKSQGTHFDIGAAFALRKRVKVVESEPLTLGKSFQNLLHEYVESELGMDSMIDVEFPARTELDINLL